MEGLCRDPKSIVPEEMPEEVFQMPEKLNGWLANFGRASEVLSRLRRSVPFIEHRRRN
jgi:hypothetical protein